MPCCDAKKRNRRCVHGGLATANGHCYEVAQAELKAQRKMFEEQLAALRQQHDQEVETQKTHYEQRLEESRTAFDTEVSCMASAAQRRLVFAVG